MNKNTSLVKFGIGNAKLRGRRVIDGEDKGLIYTFTLPSGYTCPGAKLCRSKFDRELGRIVDGKETVYRCFAASGETRPNVRELADHNLRLLKGCYGDCGLMADLLCASLPAEAKIVRVHVGGDFFSNAYFQAWMRVARRNPGVRFYAYTKSLPFWVSNEIPDNFKLTASCGGRWDHLIRKHGLKTTRVVFSIEEAAALGLEIDHDDSHAYAGTDPFTLLIHGTQPAGSEAGKAVRALQGVGSYGKG